MRRVVRGAALAALCLSLLGAAPPAVTDLRYKTVVRPLLSKHGCDAGTCHGQFKGGGFFFQSVNPEIFADYQSVLARIDRARPARSPLLQKAFGQVPHNGGINLRPESCDAQRLLAWIAARPDPRCEAPPPTPQGDAERFGREAAPALLALGCAQRTCHGDGATAAAGKLDLSSLQAAPPDFARALRALERTQPNRRAAWRSTVLQAARGEDGIAAHALRGDARVSAEAGGVSCAYRRLYGFVIGAPESRCALAGGPAGPALLAFTQVVLPALLRRGCADGGCHGGGAGGMTLFPLGGDGHIAVHDYLALTARVEDPAQPEDSTLLRTARNKEPHGGGRRLGGDGDCIDGLLLRWLQGRPVAVCPPPLPPSFARFVSEVQPTLDHMTCSQQRCHGGEAVPGFRLFARPRPAEAAKLERNYREALKFIDYDFMPMSGLQLRMREPCAYATVGAWIEGQPRPRCTMRPPDPGLFPQLGPAKDPHVQRR